MARTCSCSSPRGPLSDCSRSSHRFPRRCCVSVFMAATLQRCVRACARSRPRSRGGRARACPTSGLGRAATSAMPRDCFRSWSSTPHAARTTSFIGSRAPKPGAGRRVGAVAAAGSRDAAQNSRASARSTQGLRDPRSSRVLAPSPSLPCDRDRRRESRDPWQRRSELACALNGSARSCRSSYSKANSGAGCCWKESIG